MQPQACRLFVLIAREAPVAVILRHGPKKQTRIIRWNLRTDQFEAGQWFKGTLYDHYADLSPSGQYMIYFASKHTGDPEAWTAISKPPYLTALAFWPMTHSNTGGGLMDTDFDIRLNHRDGEAALAKGFRLRKGMTAVLRHSKDRWGKDFYAERLALCGWHSQGQVFLLNRKRKTADVYDKTSAGGMLLRMTMIVQGGKNERHDRVDYQVIGPDNDLWLNLPEVDWADWDHNGDFLLANKGRLYRCRAEDVGADMSGKLLCLADFGDMRFEPVKPPPAARFWPYD